MNHPASAMAPICLGRRIQRAMELLIQAIINKIKYQKRANFTLSVWNFVPFLTIYDKTNRADQIQI